MFKSLMALVLFMSVPSSSYVGVESIEGYQSNDSKKEIVFNFVSGYTSSHMVNVEISVFNNDDKYIASYVNDLNFIGDKSASTKIDFNVYGNFYVLIDVYYKEQIIVDSAKLNFYVQEDCDLDKENKLCKRVYKSEYKNRKSTDLLMNLNIKSSSFDKFLATNKLGLEEIQFNSEYDFRNGNFYLLINEKIDEYDLNYFDGYKFLLGINSGKYNSFSILEDYYVNVLDFKYSESYFQDSLKTKSIYFPYTKEYKEYELAIIMEDFINIEIRFNISVSDELLGDCTNSKYCLVRTSYD